MIKVHIEKPFKAFLPEAEAYLRYFEKDGRFDASIQDPGRAAQLEPDVELRFFGVVPRWGSRAPILVGDYNSMSTGHLPRIKDVIKRTINKKPDIALTLNAEVTRRLGLQPSEVLSRPMGYFGNLVQPRSTPLFDLVYSGSISRPTVMSNLNRLAGLGLKIVIVGAEAPHGAHSRLEFAGPQPIEAVYKIYSKARFGLNITPVRYPYYFQDSTKVIEYSASGLGVVTNMYPWVCDFSKRRNGRFLDVTKVHSLADMKSFTFRVPDVRNLEWESVLSRTDLANRIVSKMDRTTP